MAHSKQIDFSHGQKTREFTVMLQDLFPVVEHFLAESEWANILFFLANKKANIDELRKIRMALKNVETKMGNYFPDYMPPKPQSIGKYPMEGVLAGAIYNLVQMSMHLRGLSDQFITMMEHGQDPNRL